MQDEAAQPPDQGETADTAQVPMKIEGADASASAEPVPPETEEAAPSPQKDKANAGSGSSNDEAESVVARSNASDDESEEGEIRGLVSQLTVTFPCCSEFLAPTVLLALCVTCLYQSTAQRRPPGLAVCVLTDADSTLQASSCFLLLLLSLAAHILHHSLSECLQQYTATTTCKSCSFLGLWVTTQKCALLYRS